MNFIHTVTNSEVDVSDLMIEQEVKFGPKTGLEAVQNGEHAVVGMASSDDKTSPLVRVTWRLHEAVCAPDQKIRVSESLSARICIYMATSVLNL